MSDRNSFHLDSHPSAQSPVHGPRTPVERAICGIWASFLNREQIGIEEDFYAIGGTPALAEQIAEEIRQVFQLERFTECLFEAHTVTGQAASIEDARRFSEHARFSIPKAKRNVQIPQSFAQQRLWFVDQLAPNIALYNNGMAAEFRGPLDIAVLARSLNEIIRRHEALRTTFPHAQGQPFQIIAPALTLPIPTVDLQTLESPDRQTEVSRLIEEESRQPFNLSSGPLVRAKIIILGPQHFFLLLSIHHIICDGWSMGVLVREFNAIYRAFQEGLPSPLPELPVQYADFSAWQRERLQGAFLDTQLEYWRTKLQNLPPVLRLPTDWPRPDTVSFRGATHRFPLPARLGKALRDLSLRQDMTLFMILLAAYAILLRQYSGDEDFCIGTPSANRSRAELDGLIGLFINMLALRVDLAGDPVFLDFLQQIKQTTLEAYAHQDLPFELLVEKLHPKREPNRNPFFQAVFILANFQLQPLQIPGLETHLTDIDTHTAKFDLSLYIFEQTAGVYTCKMEYSTDLFEAATIAWMGARYQAILQAIAKDPQQPIRQYFPLQPVGPETQRSSMDEEHLSEEIHGDREDFRL